MVTGLLKARSTNFGTRLRGAAGIFLAVATCHCCAFYAGADEAAAERIKEEAIAFRGTLFRVVRVAPERLRLFSKGDDGLVSVRIVGARVRADGKRLLFAMNAGIFGRGYVPTGLHVEGGREVVKLNTGLGERIEQGGQLVTQNFYLKPNGVFFVDAAGKAGVLETGRYAAAGKEVRLATQSGPLLLEKGKVHPAFREGSANVRHRNGIGVDRDGRVVMAITADSETVNFFDLAKLFAELGCEDALYLDGDLSVMAVEPRAGLEPAGGLGGVIAVESLRPNDDEGG